jgi:hypothetical protein
MNLNEVRANSATSFGILDCPPKYVTETYMGGLSEQAKFRLDRGRRAHDAFAAVNRMLRDTGSCQAEEVQAIAGAVGLGLHDTAKLAEGLTWYAKRFDGMKPVAVEEDGGRWETTIGGVVWKGKIDAVFMRESAPEGESALVIVEGKWDFIPWEEENARYLTQNVIYAERGLELFQQSSVTVLMVSLTGKRTTPVTYTLADVDAYRPYLDRAGVDVNARHVKLVEAGEAGLSALLKDDPEFAPRMNGYCPGCSIRGDCSMYKDILTAPLKATESSTRHESYQKMGLASSIIEKARKGVKKDLLPEVELAGPEGVVEGGWRARIKPVHKDAYTVEEHDESWLVVEPEGKWSEKASVPGAAPKKGKKS